MSKFYQRKQEEDAEVLKTLLKDMKKVKYYGYRQAIVENIIFCFRDYPKNKVLLEIEKRLYEEVKEKKQNHEVFTVELKKGGELHIMLVDSYLLVGLSLNKKIGDI